VKANHGYGGLSVRHVRLLPVGRECLAALKQDAARHPQ
jgi:hypothetical protein